jgi:SNF2 family DNA or RNA helicase
MTLVAESTKLRMLFEQLYQVVVQKGEKVIIYTDWPVPLYVATLSGATYGFAVGNLRAGMTNLQRRNTIREFTDPKSKKFMVLVCSSRTSAAGLNL